MRRQIFCGIAVLATLSTVALAQEKKPALLERPCVFTVLLPADARLEIEGYPVKSRGEIRLFESPPLPVGKTYIYTLRAIHGGIVVTRTIEVSPGKPVEIDLRPDFGVRVPFEPPVKPQKKAEPPEKVGQPPHQETKPTPTKEKPAPIGSFSISGFRDVILTAGATVPVRLTVQRENLDGLISLQYAGLPKGVSINQTTIPANANYLDLMISAGSGVSPGKYAATVSAKATGMQRTYKFHVLVVEELKVKPALPPVAKPEEKTLPPAKPEGNKTQLPTEQSTIQHPFGFLVVSGPKSVTLSPGQTASLAFKVSRNRVTGPLHLRWLDLPSYLSAPAVNVKEDADTVVLSLSVPADAAPTTRDFRLEMITAGGAIRLEIPIRIEIR